MSVFTKYVCWIYVLEVRINVIIIIIIIIIIKIIVGDQQNRIDAMAARQAVPYGLRDSIDSYPRPCLTNLMLYCRGRVSSSVIGNSKLFCRRELM